MFDALTSLYSKDEPGYFFLRHGERILTGEDLCRSYGCYDRDWHLRIKPSILDAALSYVARGWEFFPAPPGAKKSYKSKKHSGANWGKTTDPQQVRRDFKKWPNANIGIATGLESGFFVVEADTIKGHQVDGIAELRKLEANDETLPETLMVESPSGSVHRYFKHPGAGIKIKNSASEIAPGVDVRGDGGMVIAPPSIKPGSGAYRWINTLPLTDAPQWLLSLVVDKPKQKASKSNGGFNYQGPPGTSKGPEAPLGEIEAALAVIPNADLGWEEWNRIAMATWRATNGAGFNAFDRWSQKSSKYNVHESTAERWAKISQRPPTQIGAGSLFYLANKAAPGWRKAYKTKLAAEEAKHSTTKPPLTPLFTDLTDKGAVRASCANACTAIEALGIVCRYDCFHVVLTTESELLGNYSGEVTDYTAHMLRKLMWKHFEFDPGREATWDAIFQLCLANEFNPVVSYLDGLKWDKTPRVDRWFTTYLGAPNTTLNRAIGKIILVAMVKRARKPGCKFDQITVLEGPEGTLKSSALLALAGSDENFSDQTILGERDREQQELLRGVWVYEVADLTGIKRADVDHIKAFASRTHDRARRAWGRMLTAQPRTCIIFATTNNDVYLKSQTGNRRFWPIATGVIKLDDLKRDRDQLLAEAAAYEAAGFPLTLDSKLWGEARDVQAERTEYDPWMDILSGVTRDVLVTENGGYLTAADSAGREGEERVRTGTLYELLEVPKDRRVWFIDHRIKTGMVRLGWQGPKLLRFSPGKDGSIGRGYWRPFPPPPVTEAPEQAPPVTGVPEPPPEDPQPAKRPRDFSRYSK